ncbi:MAG: SRPBCC domain-containing protein [Gemmatimonadales bacterium]|nr:SRPBCC domain-containing protein [Gemmatimonadales bacterium]
MDLEFQVNGKIARPVAEVFDAVYNPKKLSGYFTTGVEPGRLIVLGWEAAEGGYETEVRMEFEALEGDATLVRISESGWKETPAGLKSSYGNCMGWTQMLCCLKVYLEQGVNLRAFFF